MSDEALVLLAWDAVTSDAALEKLLARLAEAFGCRSAALVYKDRLTPAADITVAHGPFADAAIQRRYALQYAALDPAPAALARLAVGDVADTDTLFPEHERDRYRAFLEGFYYPIGLAGALGAPLCKGETRIGMVAVHRDFSRPAFDERDSDRLRRLVPHLTRMVEMRKAFFSLDERVTRLADALEPLTGAVMLLDAGGIVTEANATARRLFARDDGLVLSRSGRLSTRHAGTRQDLQKAFDSAEDESLVRVQRAGGASPYVLRVTHARKTAGWTVLVSDPDSVSSLRPETLAAALGLSGAAAELLAALLDGETLNAFCARRTMSRNTAKYHLRAAFLATGAKRQADLLRLGTAVLRDLAL